MAGDLYQELKRRNIFKAAIVYVIASWLVMQFVQAIFPALHLPATWTDIVFALLFLGFPFLILFVWMYEITPKGLRRQEDVIPGKSIAQKTGRKIDILIVVLLVFALLVTAAQFSTRFSMQELEEMPSASIDDAISVDDESLSDLPRTSLGSEKSVAVLPFKNMSPDPENEYFSDGISEELLNRLVQVDGLRVPSRTSSFAFKGKDVDLQTIGEKLNVDHVLEGSVRKSGDRVRITAQLIDIDTDANLWTESYDRALTDIFEIQEEISRQIVESLKVALNTGNDVLEITDDVPTQNIEAYQLYLQGRQLWQRRGADNLRKSIGLFEQAIALDPGFAEGYMGLASTYNVMASWTGKPQATFNPLARDNVQKALAIDNSLDEAYAVLAGVAQGDGQWVQAERNFKHALSLNQKNPYSHIWFSEMLMRAGRAREALSLARTAYSLDPLSIPVNDILATAYLYNGMHDEAIHHSNISREMGGPTVPSDWIVAYFRGDFDHAAFAHEQFLSGFNLEPLPGREVFAAIKDPSKRDIAMRAMAEASKRDGTDRHQLFTLYYILGEPDLGFDLISDIKSATFPPMFWWQPQNTELRQTEGFRNLYREAGLVEFWQKSEWADLCRPVGDDFECS